MVPDRRWVRDSNMGLAALRCGDFGPRSIARRPVAAPLCDTRAMTIVLIAVALYLAAAGWLALDVRRGRDAVARAWLLPAIAAVLLHGAAHYLAWHRSGSTDLHFFAALSLVGLGMAALTALVGAAGRMARAGRGRLPALGRGVAGVCPAMDTRPAAEPLDWRLQLHAWLALLAYATLAMSALLAIMLWAQERALRRREFHGWLRALPPLTELESLLFRSIAVGFVLLTATLLTGLLFVETCWPSTWSTRPCSACCPGWPSARCCSAAGAAAGAAPRAVRWTLVAMALLVLAFFGSKFVLELVLHRTG